MCIVKHDGLFLIHDGSERFTRCNSINFNKIMINCWIKTIRLTLSCGKYFKLDWLCTRRTAEFKSKTHFTVSIDLQDLFLFQLGILKPFSKKKQYGS